MQTTDDIALTGWYLPAPKAQHALLYCHGNGGDIRDWVQAVPPFLDAGVSVLVWDYRGYGRSQGRPSESGLYLDVEAVWQWLRQRARREGLPASILGKSLGSSVAIHAAIQAPPYCLILDSAFTSMREIVAANAPWLPAVMIPNLYETLPRAPEISAPTLLIHGGSDTLVPPAQGQRLYEAVTAPKALKVIPRAGHNDVSSFPEYHAWIAAFLADASGFIENG